jgi:hypothetical protein
MASQPDYRGGSHFNAGTGDFRPDRRKLIGSRGIPISKKTLTQQMALSAIPHDEDQPEEISRVKIAACRLHFSLDHA